MGRPKGSQNKVQKLARDLAEDLGVNPLEILLRFAANDWEGLGYSSQTVTKPVGENIVEVERISPELRMSAAREAVKYCYPALKSMEHKAEGDGFKVVITDYGA